MRPAPVHQPRPPIMIGGTGEKKTLVANYADASNMFALGVDALGAKLDTLARHCEAGGRRRVREARRRPRRGLIPVTSHPVGFVAQLGETIVPRLAQIPAT